MATAKKYGKIGYALKIASRNSWRGRTRYWYGNVIPEKPRIVSLMRSIIRDRQNRYDYRKGDVRIIEVFAEVKSGKQK